MEQKQTTCITKNPAPVNFKPKKYNPCKGNPNFRYTLINILKTTFYNQYQPFASLPGQPNQTYIKHSYFEDMILKLTRDIHDRTATPCPLLHETDPSITLSDFYGPFKQKGVTPGEDQYHFV